METGPKNGGEALLQNGGPAENGATRAPAVVSIASDASQGGNPRASPVLFLAVGLCCLSPLLFGFSIAFTSPSQATMEGDSQKGVQPPSYLVALSPSTESWYASLVNIGAVVGAFSGSALGDRYGRKTALAFTSLPHIVAWVGTAFSRSPAFLIVFRILVGWAIGMGSAVTPVYIGEVATTELRGSLGAANQLSITIGIFLANIVGTYTFVVDYGTPPQSFCQWRHMALFGAGLGVVLALTALVPESPKWLAKRGDAQGTLASLGRLRLGDPSAEASEMLAASSPAEGAAPGADAGAAAADANRLGRYGRSLFIGVGLCVFQQFSGMNAVIMYTSKICAQAGVQNSDLASIAVMGLQVVLTGVSCALMERAGRRCLLLFAASCMTMAQLVLSYYFLAQDHGLWAPNWVALAALGANILGFSLGLGPIPWLILAELFPTEVRGAASSIATAANWSCSFIVTLTFLPLQDAITKQGTFLLYSVVCATCFAFVLVLVPETKGRTVEEVLAQLGSRPRQARDVALENFPA